MTPANHPFLCGEVTAEATTLTTPKYVSVRGGVTGNRFRNQAGMERYSSRILMHQRGWCRSVEYSTVRDGQYWSVQLRTVQ